MKKVLVAQKLCKEAQDILYEVAELKFITEGNLEEFKEVLMTEDIIGVILGTWTKFTKEMIY